MALAGGNGKLGPFMSWVPVLVMILLAAPAASAEQTEKTIENIRIAGSHADGSFTVRPDTAAVTLRWPAAYFPAEIPEENIRAWVNLEGLGPGVHVRPAKIRLPENARLLRIEPVLFTVTINPEETGSGKK